MNIVCRIPQEFDPLDLRRCDALTELEAEFIQGLPRFFPAVLNLHTLRLVLQPEVKPDFLLDDLTLPALRYLAILRCEIRAAKLKALITRSRCRLESLTVIMAHDTTQEDFRGLFNSLPSLHRLSLTLQKLDPLLVTLTYTPPHTTLLPNLYALVMEGRVCSVGRLVTMIESRTLCGDHQDVQQLDDVIIGVIHDPGRILAPELKRLWGAHFLQLVNHDEMRIRRITKHAVD